MAAVTWENVCRNPTLQEVQQKTVVRVAAVQMPAAITRPAARCSSEYPEDCQWGCVRFRD
jgi:hypothetical protein